ncbi:hypothetical protein Pan153_63270 [Gimesia panareensis]|uniref:DUF2262 domain-containing protein n=1 Tax=Gimesia panareensis TaxID=2527978 RepID=A0A518FZ46_9PLAN|nr:hypothetical protein [Gimesia panareensis]QDV21637.1 hypothetical protein Pan153_63270 [Gimesia panareensis]
MGFFSKLLKWFQPEEYEDADLGRLISVGSGYWDGAWTLEPGGTVIPFSITGRPESVPSEQRNFMLQVKDRFTEIEQELARTMFQGIDPLDDGSTPEEVFSHMELTSVFFTELDASPREWQIWYVNDLDPAGHAICVEMKDWKYDGFSMNG